MSDSTADSDASPKTPALDPRIAWDFCRFSGGWWTGRDWSGRSTGMAWALWLGLGLGALVLTAIVFNAVLHFRGGVLVLAAIAAGALGAAFVLTRGRPTRAAWLLTIGLALCLAASTAVTVALNHWNRWFFDALEKKDVTAVWSAVFSVIGIVGCMAAIGVGIVLCRETLQIRWRAWLIDGLIARWVGERRFYHLEATRTAPANPEYRIADDSRWATEPLTDLAIGLVIAVFNAVAFISILWSVGGSITVSGVTIPAYMVLVAIVWGTTMSCLMLWIGKPLPSLVYAKNEREGDFRFALMRVRENAESVALMSGHGRERVMLGSLFDKAVSAWLLIVRRHGHVTWITNSAGPLSPIVPLLFAAPKYLSGDLTLGQVTQLAGAFVAVQGAISWIVDNFNRISEWYASARRVMDIVDACDAADVQRGAQPASIAIASAPMPAGQTVALADVTVADPSGAALLTGVSFRAETGSSTHITGDTSVGKTTLVRALAGLWTRGGGRVELPADQRIMVVPQKPYLPLGTLAEALRYPEDGAPISDGRLAEALAAVDLGHLVGEMHEPRRWDQTLSNGERQRLGIARVIAHAPGVVVLDDALSAIEGAAQVELMKALRTACPGATIVSLSQAQPPAGLHDQVLAMVRTGKTATVRGPDVNPIVKEKV